MRVGWRVAVLAAAVSACSSTSVNDPGATGGQGGGGTGGLPAGGAPSGGGTGAMGGTPGACVPGSMRQCGTCGQQTCSPAGTWCNCFEPSSCSCNGNSTHNACLVSGCFVCAESVKLSDYPCYRDNYPGCQQHHDCKGEQYACNGMCPPPSANDACTCIGSPSDWPGCRDSGCAVCAQAVKDYACYFINNPECSRDTECGDPPYDSCDPKCPAPVAADMGSSS